MASFRECSTRERGYRPFAHDSWSVNVPRLFDWLVCEEVLLAGLCKEKILFLLKIYDRLRQAMTK